MTCRVWSVRDTTWSVEAGRVVASLAWERRCECLFRVHSLTRIYTWYILYHVLCIIVSYILLLLLLFLLLVIVII
jgi:hypothetical protein